jgi:hypothetical protein
MNGTIEQVRARVADQKIRQPELYGNIDFDRAPERFTEDPADSVAPASVAGAEPTPEQIALIRAYTLLGDRVADAYAGLMPQYGFRGLIGLLTRACDDGLEAVPDAPPELVAFIRDMEAVPDWVDMDLVREGARLDRNATANLSPFAIRGAFVATFMNKYAALPMALTGTLGNETAAKRVNETASFFTTTLLPGALDRDGPGFKAAAMVRLMHSMVRFNALRRPGAWNAQVYGVPIPQVDQMPAGLIPIFLLSYKLLRKGRTTFTPAERAKVELARYRCHLLGLPEDLLADTPVGIVQTMSARNQTLRRGFDDETCGALVRATLAAYLPPDRSWRNRVFDTVERGFAKALFVRHFMGGDREAATRMGVRVTAGDRALFVLVAAIVTSRMLAYGLALKVPGLREIADRDLVRQLRRHLVRYGHAEYTTDAAQYRPTTAKAEPVAA